MSDESERDKLERFVRENDPSWKADGIRGPQSEQFSLREQGGLSPAQESANRRESIQPAFPEQETEDGGGKIDATVVDVYGAQDGEPALFHLFQDSPPDLIVPEP